MQTPNMGKSVPSSRTVCRAMPESSGRPVQHYDTVRQPGKLEDGLFEADALSVVLTQQSAGIMAALQQCRLE